jgi:hypothetical protein
MTAIEHEPSWTADAAHRRAHWRRPAMREFVLLAAVYELYTLTRRIAAGDAGDAVANAHHVLRMEHFAGLAPERWLNHAVSVRPLLAIPADYAYATLHYVVTAAVLVWLWRAHRTVYLPARRTLVAATLLGLIGFATVPLAPPRMMPGFIDTMARYGDDGWWGSAASAPKGLGSFTNQFAAMPSLHVAWAIWCGVVVARHAHRAWVRGIGVGYPVLVVVVVLGTANHYLLDAVAGLAALLAAHAIVRAAVRLGRLKLAPPTPIGSR